MAEDTLIARLADGRQVLLSANGTWQYIEAPPQSEAASFRRASWGMSQSQVEALEPVPPVLKDHEILQYEGFVAALSCTFLYAFVDDVLVSGTYTIIAEHADNNAYIGDFDSIKNALTEKYGRPEREGPLWKNELFLDDPQNWGTAVVSGHLAFMAQWRLPATTVFLMLGGDNYMPSLFIRYSSIAHAELEEAAMRRSQLADL